MWGSRSFSGDAALRGQATVRPVERAGNGSTSETQGGGAVAFGPSPSLAAEVTFISGVNPNGTLASPSFSTWNYDSPATYSTTDSYASKWGADTAGTSGGTVLYWFDAASNWNATEKSAFVAGLSLWSSLANIQFAPAASAAEAKLNFTRNSEGSAHTAGSLSGTGSAGTVGGTHLWTRTSSTVTIDTSVPSFGPIDGLFTTAGGYVWGTILHEEGHMLGLGHSGGYDGAVNAMTEQYSAYDNSLWSLMSYIDPTDQALYSGQYPVTGTDWGVAADFYPRSPTTPMALDILAAQRLYGVPATTVFDGGEVFGFNCNIAGAVGNFFNFTVNVDPIVTIWDKGVNNTLDLSGFGSASNVNLTAGSFSSCDGMVNNLCIAFDTRIDTLITGNGNDTLRANAFGNYLSAGAGNDALFGGALSDILIGGAGTDKMTGGAGNDTYFVDNANDKVVEANNQGTDTIEASLTFALTGLYVENLTLGGSGNFNAGGNGFNNVLIGNSGNNSLNGGLNGDTMSGGAGNDLYFVDNAGDVVNENANEGKDAVNASITYTLGANVETLVLTGYQAIDGTGNGLDNTLTGNGNVNHLAGGDGKDLLIGQGGNDILSGGAGTDTFRFYAPGAANGLDHLTDFLSGTDKLQFTAADYGFTAGHVLAAQEYHTGGAVGAFAQFLYNTVNHTIYFDADGTGSTAAVAVVTFDNNAVPVAADFAFV